MPSVPLFLDPLASAIDAYLLALEAEGRAPKTLRIYRTALMNLAAHAGPVEPSSLTPDALRAWLAAMAASGLAPLSQIGYLRVAKQWLRWLSVEKSHGVTKKQHRRIRELVKPPPRPDDGVKPLRKEDVAALFAGCNPRGWMGIRMRAMLALLLDTGIRASECCGLTLADVDLARGEIFVRAETSKVRRGRAIALGRRARREMGQWWARKRHLMDPSPDSPWFCTREEKPITDRALHHLLTRHGTRCGVPNCHPHRFRHTAAIEALRGGMGEIAVMRTLGHVTLDMTKRYVAYLDSDVSREKQAAAWLDRVRL